MWSQRLKPARKKCFFAGRMQQKMAQVLKKKKKKKKKKRRRGEKKKEHPNQDLDYSPSESEFADDSAADSAARNRTPILPLSTIF
jgi:hypothetical protein